MSNEGTKHARDTQPVNVRGVQHYLHGSIEGDCVTMNNTHNHNAMPLFSLLHLLPGTEAWSTVVEIRENKQLGHFHDNVGLSFGCKTLCGEVARPHHVRMDDNSNLSQYYHQPSFA